MIRQCQRRSRGQGANRAPALKSGPGELSRWSPGSPEHFTPRHQIAARFSTPPPLRNDAACARVDVAVSVRVFRLYPEAGILERGRQPLRSEEHTDELQ